MPVTLVQSKWDSGALVFHDADDYGVGAEILRIAQDDLAIGTSTNDVTMTMYGDVTLYGDLSLEDEDLTLHDDQDIEFGSATGGDVLMRWSTGDDSNHAFVIGIGDTSQQMHITDKGAIATDWVRSAGTHPELAIHSNTTPSTDYLAIGNHDGTTAYIDVVGGTTLQLNIAGTGEVSLTASALSPVTSNGNALGTTALMWADLFLAEGGVINWNNSNVTLTHAAGQLTSTGTIISSNTTAGFTASGAATDGITVSGACTDGIDISGACTNAIHITSTASAMGLLYDVDMTTQIGANVEGVKVILERTADVTVATGTLVAGEFIVKKGDTGWSNKPATNVYGVRIAIGGSCTDASGSVMGLRCETQTNGYVDYLGYFSLNSGCSMAATGGVLCVNAFENANGGILVACSNSATMTVGLNFSDVNSGGTITSLLNIEDGANTTNFLKSTLANGCIAATSSGGATRSHKITCDIAGVAYYLSLYTD